MTDEKRDATREEQRIPLSYGEGFVCRSRAEAEEILTNHDIPVTGAYKVKKGGIHVYYVNGCHCNVAYYTPEMKMLVICNGKVGRPDAWTLLNCLMRVPLVNRG